MSRAVRGSCHWLQLPVPRGRLRGALTRLVKAICVMLLNAWSSGPIERWVAISEVRFD